MALTAAAYDPYSGIPWMADGMNGTGGPGGPAGALTSPMGMFGRAPPQPTAAPFGYLPHPAAAAAAQYLPIGQQYVQMSQQQLMAASLGTAVAKFVPSKVVRS